MKLNFKTSLIAASIAAGIFGVSAIAVAQNADGKGPSAEMMAKHGDGHGAMRGEHRGGDDHMARMQARMAQHQAKLKADLKLAPEQEAAWNAFVARTAHEPRTMGGKDGAQREDWSKLTTPERLDKMMARHAERSEQMSKRIDATKSFYATLSPEQQKTFDAQSMHGFQRTGMKGGKGSMGKHRHGEGHGDGHGKGMMFKGQGPATDMPGKAS